MKRLLPLLTLIGVVVIGGGATLGARTTASPAPGVAAPGFLMEPFSHETYDRILRAVVDPASGHVEWAVLRSEHLEELGAYLLSMAEVEPELWPESDQKAFWLNAHNAAALYLIGTWHDAIAAERVDLRQIIDRSRLRVAGRQRSPRHLRMRIAYTFGDPRMMAALSWGAADSPPLHAEAFRPAAISLQLDRVSQAYWTRDDVIRVDESAFPPRVTLGGYPALYPGVLCQPGEEIEDAIERLRPELRPYERWQWERRSFDWSLG